MRHGSTSPSTERPPNKRQLIPSKNNKKEKTMDTNNDTIITKCSANQTGIDLNPELCELKRQLFAGFKQMIEPLKCGIEVLKSERDTRNLTLIVETLSMKLHQNDEKHRKLEDQLSLIEDQLLEKNLICQGITKMEYEDKSDIKVQVVKAMPPTMSGEDAEEKKTNAGKDSIESVE